MTFWLTALSMVVGTGFSLLRLPSDMLGLVVSAFPKDHPRPKALIAELNQLPFIRRLLWVYVQMLPALREGLLARWQSRRGRSEQAIRTADRRVRFLLKIVVRLLPPSERDRYSEEFHAEMLDVPRDTRLSHALSLLRGVSVLRLRRGLKKATDAALRRVKG
jgi:hypothetical protein